MLVTRKVHRIETEVAGRYACVFLVVGAETSMLVDTGMSYAAADSILPYFEANGIDPQSVGWVIVTHSDFDHAGGIGPLRKALPKARFLCHESERAQVEDVEELIAHRLGEYGAFHGMPDPDEVTNWVRENTAFGRMDSTLAGGERIDLGGVVVSVDLVPGHSAGHLALHVEEAGLSIVADAVLLDGLYLRDGSPAFPPTYRYAASYLRTTERLIDRNPSIMLTSHYDVCEGSEVQRFLETTRAFHDRLDGELESFMRAANDAITLKEATFAIAPNVGDWEPDAQGLLSWPLLGHIERLIVVGRAECLGVDTPHKYRWAA